MIVRKDKKETGIIDKKADTIINNKVPKNQD